MRRIEIAIVNSSDTDLYRDTAADVLRRLEQLFQFELNYDIAIGSWDYRAASPALVTAGALAAPSLRVIDRSQACIAIFGRRAGPVLRQEVTEMVERQARGDAVGLFVFVNQRHTRTHTPFFEELASTFGWEPRWGPYTDPVSFQALVYTTVVGFLLDHLEIKNPALLAGAA